MPDPAPRVVHVTLSSRHEMDMAMKYGLTGVFSDIHTNVEARDHGVCLQDVRLEAPQEIVAGRKLFLGQLKVIGRMSLGNYQRVQMGNRKTIANGKRQVILKDDPLRSEVAEGTWIVTVNLGRHGVSVLRND
jgi:hypothetical protein